MKYNVYLFTVVRVKVPDIEADTKKQAIKKATAYFDDISSDMLIKAGPYEAEYADEITEYLVESFLDNGDIENSEFMMGE